MMEHIDVITDCHVKNGDLTANGKASTGTHKKRPNPLLSISQEFSPNFSNSLKHGSKGNSSKHEINPSRAETNKTLAKTTVHIESLQKPKPLKRQRSNRSSRSTTSTARRRQNEDGCVTCLRGTLHCYNVFILLIGCAALGIGIWLLVTDFGARKVTPIVGNQLYEVTTYLLIAGGGAVALLAFCGCCGTIREDKCVLSFYGTTLAIVLIVLGAACGLAFFFRSELAVKIQNRMRDTLTMNYGHDVRTNTENRRITEAWDAMQRQLKCCGVVGNVTSHESWSYFNTKTRWNFVKKGLNRRVPDSCCAPGDINICIGETDFQGPPRFFQGHREDMKRINPYLYTNGCYDNLIEHLKTYSTIVGAVAAIVPLFLILGIVISFCLCSRVSGYAQEDDV